MNHIKYFENKMKPKYQVGDFVKLKLIPDFVRDIENIEENLYTKIEKIDLDYYNVPIYDFELIITGKRIYGYENMIRRKMTTKEIKDYKIKKEADKYNL